MRILFIRHAEAVEADAFEGSDLERPLTPEGKKQFARVVRRLVHVYPRPDALISSQAVRARQTARMLAKGWKLKGGQDVAALNPGATPTAISGVVSAVKGGEWIVLVGHEPDFSQAIARWVSGGTLDLKLKKGGVVEIETLPRGRARLRAVWDPARL